MFTAHAIFQRLNQSRNDANSAKEGLGPLRFRSVDTEKTISKTISKQNHPFLPYQQELSVLDISDFVGFLHCFPSVRRESAGEGLDSWMNHGSRMPDPSPIRLVDLDDSWVVQKHAHLCISLHDVGLVRREPNRLHDFVGRFHPFCRKCKNIREIGPTVGIRGLTDPRFSQT